MKTGKKDENTNNTHEFNCLMYQKVTIIQFNIGKS